ncbi:FecR family protein [Sinomicrobium sp. M5D2P9]
MDRKELLQFIAKEGDAEFQKRVISWIKASPENREYFNRLKAEQVAAFRFGQKNDIPREFRKFSDRIRRGKRNYYRTFSTVAVAAIAIFVALFFVLGPGDTEDTIRFSAMPSEQKQFNLADGSSIFLNSGSTLEVVPGFNKEARTVRLNGEAFFDVTPNEQIPFIVETRSGVKIKVLGTSFNIRSYTDNKTVETTLLSGKVEIYEEDNPTPSAVLAPRQKAIFRKEQKDIRIEQQVATEAVISWKEGVLTFDNTPLNSVTKDIERWYGVSVEIEDKAIEAYTFSGKFRKHYDITQVLNILRTSSPIHYNYDKVNNRVTLKQRD